MNVGSILRLVAGVSLCCALGTGPVRAQGNEAALQYRGADRDSRLVERATQEGSVVLYTSLAPTESRPLADAFEKKYGVKVELWRALSDKVVQRAVTEAQAKRHLPQFKASLRTSVSQPSAAFSLHSAKPAGQGPVPQRPLMQACDCSQPLPQPPHAAASVS